jgi:zinc transporter ZupT
MGLAAGGFIYVLLRDLIPHAINDAKKTKTMFQHGVVFIIGITVMFLVNNIVPHEHEQDDSVVCEQDAEQNKISN